MDPASRTAPRTGASRRAERAANILSSFFLRSPRPAREQGLSSPARQPLAVPVCPLHRRRGRRQGPSLRAHLAVPALRHFQQIRDIRGRPNLK